VRGGWGKVCRGLDGAKENFGKARRC